MTQQEIIYHNMIIDVIHNWPTGSVGEINHWLRTLDVPFYDSMTISHDNVSYYGTTLFTYSIDEKLTIPVFKACTENSKHVEDRQQLFISELNHRIATSLDGETVFTTESYHIIKNNNKFILKYV